MVCSWQLRAFVRCNFRFSFSVESAPTLENLRVGETALRLALDFSALYTVDGSKMQKVPIFFQFTRG